MGVASKTCTQGDVRRVSGKDAVGRTADPYQTLPNLSFTEALPQAKLLSACRRKPDRAMALVRCHYQMTIAAIGSLNFAHQFEDCQSRHTVPKSEKGIRNRLRGCDRHGRMEDWTGQKPTTTADVASVEVFAAVGATGEKGKP